MYDFESTDFALSEAGIHLLRSGFNYKTIAYNEVEKAVLKRGFESKRPVLSFIIGTALIVVALYLQSFVFMELVYPTAQVIYIQQILLPLFPMIAGTYLLYLSLKKGPLFCVEAGKERHLLRLKQRAKSKEMQQLKEYLRLKLPNKLDEYYNM